MPDLLVRSQIEMVTDAISTTSPNAILDIAKGFGNHSTSSRSHMISKSM